jgi:hypothetical protein
LNFFVPRNPSPFLLNDTLFFKKNKKKKKKKEEEEEEEVPVLFSLRLQ